MSTKQKVDPKINPGSYNRILFFDTETSGLFDYRKGAHEPGQPYLCELATVLVDRELNELQRFQSYIKPTGWTIDPGAAEAHGLTVDFLAEHGRPVEEVLNAWEEAHDASDLLVAYQVDFDLKVMRGAMRRAGRDDRYGLLPKWCPMALCTKIAQLPPTDAMLRAGRTHFKTAKLSEAHAAIFGSPHEGAHGALSDVLATVQIVRELRQRKLLAKESAS